MLALLLLLTLLASAVALWRDWRRVRHFLHVAQLSGYKPNEFVPWVRTHPSRTVAPSHAVGLVLLLVLLGVGSNVWVACLAAFAWAIGFSSAVHVERHREKKPLVFTSRMKRLAAVALLLAVLPLTGGLWAALKSGLPLGTLPLLTGLFASDLLAPFWVWAALRTTRPLEARIQEEYKKQARYTLSERHNDLTIVGITGSYGKTSTKFAVAEVLQQRIQTLATPSSYNTPMGLCLVVNNKLRPHHRALVLEYGIRYKGDMDELIDLARPDIAVLTSIGVAHLETMGSVEAIANEKWKLIERVRENGQVILNADDETVMKLRDRIPSHLSRVWTVSADNRSDTDIAASDIRYDPSGAQFTIRDDSGAIADVSTRLLGKHNVLNLLLASAVGRAAGLRLRQIVRGLARVEPVAHRLALRTEPNGVVVIDDAFNSNPVGARNAVDILGQISVPDGGRRVIVTPGMIELGERQEQENQAFGGHIANALTRENDLAVLVGRDQTRPILAGLHESHFPSEKVHIADSLFEAQELLAPLLRAGDVVLYENDLPDTYTAN